MISIVIPLYNKEYSISRTIDTVLNQSYSDFELIVVNDGSTDSSLQVVQKIDDPRIRIIDKINKRVSSARNTGINVAKSQYVALIDGDDIWDSTCLQTLVDMVRDFPDAGMWGVNYAYVIEGKLYPRNQAYAPNFRGYVENYFSNFKGDSFCSSSVMINKEIATLVGLFDERMRYTEDLDLWYRIILNYPVCFNKEVHAFYNWDAENRAEKDRNKHFDIHYRWDYYIDKYEDEFKRHPSFARFVGVRVAYNILAGGYYFGDENDRRATDHIVKYLPYDVLPFKYSLIFKTPRWLGQSLYRLSLLVKRIKSKK